MQLHQELGRGILHYPPEFNPHEDATADDAEDDDHDQYGTPNLGDGSER